MVSAPASSLVPELAFAVEGAARVEHTAAPTLAFAVRVDAAGGVPIRSVLLDCQLQIEARRRAYDDDAKERLFELFGPVADWGTTLRTLLWHRSTLVVPPFTGSTVAQLQVPCSYDLEVVASRYFDALAGGEVPVEILFSGTVFWTGAHGGLQAARIPWDREAGYRLPVRVWRETLEAHFRDTAWVRLHKDAFDKLAAFKARQALPSWEATVDALMEGRE